MLRTVEAKTYDEWITHKIPFNDSQVKDAFEKFGNIALNEKYVFGGKVGIISIPFGDAPTPLFDNSPGCYLHRQASFIAEFLPDNVKPGEDVSIFLLPSIKEELGTPVLVSGIVSGMLNDTPEARKLMEYMASVEPHKIWASQGGYLSPNKQIQLDHYPDELTKIQARILADATVLRFDGSDMMTGTVGTGTFWTGIVDYVGGTDVDTVLNNIEESGLRNKEKS